MALEKNVGYWERPLRVIAGGTLLGMSMMGEKTRLTRVAEGVVGAELLWSAVSGYCPMNAAMDRDTYHGHRMRGLLPMSKEGFSGMGFGREL